MSISDTQKLGGAARATSDETLVAAMRVLAEEIQSGDGVANAAIAEAADRIEALARSFEVIRDAVLHERYQLAEAGLDCDQVNAVLGVLDDLDARVPEDRHEQ